jgi:type IV pilus assembly protein PilY1
MIKRFLASMLLIASVGQTANAAASDIANAPLYLSPPVGVNFMITLDDSGSMASEFIPENLGAGNRPRGQANKFNGLAYNPATTYSIPPWPNVTGTAFTPMGAPTFTAAYNNGPRNKLGTNTGITNLSTDYVFYGAGGAASGTAFYFVYDPVQTVLSCGPVPDPTRDRCYVRVNLQADGTKTFGQYNFGTAGCAVGSDADDNKISCYTGAAVAPPGVVVATDERQNFANWWSYYRSRNNLAISATLISIATLPQNTRVNCHVLNSNGSATTTCSQTMGPLKEFSGANQVDLYQRIAAIGGGSGTPLITTLVRVGNYFNQAPGVNSPWAFTPGTTELPILACRRSFHMFLTDGYYNSNAGATLGSYDDVSKTLPDGTAYSGTQRPYALAQQGNLGDVAFNFWSTRLGGYTTTPDKVRPSIKAPNANASIQYWNPKNDPATWFHLVNYTVGLGVFGNLPKSDATLVDLTTGALTWPAVPNFNSGDDPSKLDDLYHAAVNSRGDFYSAAKADELVSAFAEIVKSISTGQGSAAGISVTGPSASADGFAFQSTYDASNWTGELVAYPVRNDGGFDAPAWKTSQPGKIPAFGSRVVKTVAGSAVVDFNYANLTVAQRDSLRGPLVAPSPTLRKADDLAGTAVAATSGGWLIDYLKGDQAREADKPGGFYRQRINLLGDILGSGVLYVGARNFGYNSLSNAAGGDSYDAYVTAKKSQGKILVAGANDGMLHFFNAVDGTEFFNFVPPTLIPKLHELALPSYTHKYFVDGRTTEADYYTGSQWRTVVVGSTGLGGTGVFAFDVTGANRASPQLLWYFDASNYADMGYAINRVQVTRFADGNWYAVFGNGYESGTGQAKLFTVRLNGTTFNASPTVTQLALGVPGANGLSTPAIARGFNRMYAGDMQGNMWRIDTATGTPVNAFSTKALFVARNAANQVQPITSQPDLSNPPEGGILVHFGTGALYRDTGIDDRVTKDIQSFYTIWDTNPAPAALPYSRTNLAAQTINTEVETATGSGVFRRTVSNNAINLVTQRGWYLDLRVGAAAPSGERVIVSPFLIAGRVFFSTFTPTTTDPNCDGGGKSFLMGLDALSGGAGTTPTFDTNGDGIIDGNDAVTSGLTVPPSVGDLNAIAVTKEPLPSDFGADCVANVPCGGDGKQHRCGNLTASQCIPAPGSALTYDSLGRLVITAGGGPCPVGTVKISIPGVNNPALTAVCVPGNLTRPRMSWREIQ